MSLLDLLAERFDFARYRTITLATAQSLRSKAAMAYKQPGEMVAHHSPASVQFWRSDSVRLDSGSCDLTDGTDSPVNNLLSGGHSTQARRILGSNVYT